MRPETGRSTSLHAAAQWSKLHVFLDLPPDSRAGPCKPLKVLYIQQYTAVTKSGVSFNPEWDMGNQTSWVYKCILYDQFCVYPDPPQERKKGVTIKQPRESLGIREGNQEREGE